MKEEYNIFVCKSSNTFSGYEFLKFSFRVLFSPQENPWHELEKSLQLYKHLTLLRHLFVFSRFSRRRRDILRPRWHHHQHRDDRRGLVARRVQRRLRPFPSQLRGGSTMMTPRWDDLCPRPCAKKKKKKKRGRRWIFFSSFLSTLWSFLCSPHLLRHCETSSGLPARLLLLLSSIPLLQSPSLFPCVQQRTGWVVEEWFNTKRRNRTHCVGLKVLYVRMCHLLNSDSKLTGLSSI